MMSIIRRWMARLGITGLYVGRSVQHCPSGSLVVFPYEPQTVSCGITALVAFKRAAPSGLPLQTLHRTLDDIAACTWDRLKAQELDPVTHYLGGPERLGRMRALGARLKEPAPFYEVYADRAGQEQVSALAQRLAELIHAEERMRLEQTGGEALPIGDVTAARLTALRDILWSLEHDVLQTIDQVTRLGRLDQEACPRAGVGQLPRAQSDPEQSRPTGGQRARLRWASVGEISVPNCHPVDGDRSETSAIIHVCLNGDIDNYQALQQADEQETGRAVPEAITTDTKIIPLRMQKYLQRGQSVDDAFRLAVNDFEGAHAIAMHTDLAPGRVFLAQKGSGQALFIGLAPDHYVVGSEIYGFVEAASRYLKLDGTQAVPGISGTSPGQIVVLQQASAGDLAGIQAMTYDGTPMVLSPDLARSQQTHTLTKAYYAQMVAGSILGLKLAELTGVRSEDSILAEIAQLRRLPGLMQKVLDRRAEIEASARRLAVTKRYWAVVGSGPNKASADEIRIKLSELCYKTISSDIVEDKKHIDLSAEPLIVVCAAGNRDDVLSDIVKDTAIFKAHRAVPIVIASEGEHRFDPYADTVIPVPAVHAGLSPILNTLAGHLWGYYAALAIHEESRHLFAFREAIRHHVAAAVGQGRDLYEIVLDDPFREQVAAFDRVFKDKLRQDRYATALSIQTASDLTLLLKYMVGRLPSSDFEGDFGVKGKGRHRLPDGRLDITPPSGNGIERKMASITQRAP